MRATGHNYGLVRDQGLGSESVVELIRSGLVIPKINRVLKPTVTSIPDECPSCAQQLSWDSDFLICNNHDNCPAQVVGRMEYFFKVLGNNDGFGNATIEKLYENDIRTVPEIYRLTEKSLVGFGFGEKTSSNLINQLLRSHTEQIEDWRFLSAFGVVRMGMGNCENLLKNYPLEEVFELSTEQISNIDGFAELTANMIVVGLNSIREDFDSLSRYDFSLERTVLNKDIQKMDHILFSKRLVFTGKMQGSRSEMKKHATSIGVQVSSSVSSKTDFLVVGDSVGKKKIDNAKKFGIKIITEQEYSDIIST
jgi:DNA ligase (NAD+)